MLERSSLLIALAALLILIGVYLYDRSLLVNAFPELPRFVPALFPAPPPPATATSPAATAAPPRLSASAGPPSSASAAPAPTAPFDRREAVAALAIAAESARVCYDPATRIFGGMVIVTFAASGRITKVDLRGPLAGNPVGDCVAQTFERVTIAPFLGDPVPVAQQVSLR
mgnify:CR=1 FL=1